jgi:muramoyltetrapeptide carboxypeptidase
MTMRAEFRIPAPLEPGDLVRVVAPSSPFPVDDLWRGLGWLRARYRVRIDRGILERDGYLAGSDARRRAELEGAFADLESKAIIAVRGGYGAMRIVCDLSWDALAAHPKWIVGFSDVTALHAMAWRAGLPSVHGPNVTGLGAQWPRTRAAWLAAVERPTTPRVWRNLRIVHRGKSGHARGPLVGGNLSIVHAMAAAGRLAIPAGSVVALEDVTEAPYRIDRMLTSLLVGGHLAPASALVFGGFERCGPGRDGRTVDDVIAERTLSLRVPVLSGAPFGHGPDNEAFVLGLPAEVRDDTLVSSAPQS